ncbi:MAG: hypothetical protein JSV90_00110 [Methanobacteriota archaeon]|nr:MAG: hypothetical protein JSV90_00110 [Euryarchaeota archaeon]
MLLLISHKVFVGFAVWTVFSMLASLSAGLEVLLTLELIGLLMTIELTSGLLTRELRSRMEYFAYTGLLLFVIVVLRRVWLTLS